MGFAGGGNAGLKHAFSFDPKYILHINNDAFIRPSAIACLVRELEARPNVGIAHALLLYPDGNKVQFYTATVDRDVARHMHHHLGADLMSRDWPTVETDFVPACVIMYRAAALKGIGFYDEVFGTSWEDYDLCLRFKDGGWHIITVGDAISEHYASQTTGTKSPYIVYHMTRNRLICIRRYSNRSAMVRRAPLLLRSFYWDVRGYGLNNWAGHKGFFLGFWDFARGNLGEKSHFYVAEPGSHKIAAPP